MNRTLDKSRAWHVIAGLDPADGGPSYSVPRLCDSLRDEGVDARLFATFRRTARPAISGENRPPTNLFEQDWEDVPVLRKACLSRALHAALRGEVGGSDIVHSHGLWLAPNVYAGRVAQERARPLVVSPRGMLASAALAFSSPAKRAAWLFWQGPAYARAACWHATSESEARDIRAFGVKAPIAVIPNGIDLPEIGPELPSKPRERTVLYVGRLHPKKNLLCLVNAWAKVEPQRPDWRLRIVGPDEKGYRRELATQIEKLGVRSVSLEVPVYGPAKWDLMRRSSVFVVPSLNENFGLTVAEALASNLPVIATKGTPWSGLGVHRCGYWIDFGETALTEALKDCTSHPEQDLAAMGKRGRTWMEGEFAWRGVANRMAAVYKWLAAGAAIPPCVQT